VNAERLPVFLWDSGSACGVTDDPQAAARHAERFVRDGQEARVEQAISMVDQGLERSYLRTGDAHVGRPGPGGIVLWQPAAGTGGVPGWMPPAGEGAKPTVAQLGIDPGAQRWERSGPDDAAIEIAFPENPGRWERGDWVLMRVDGDADGRVLVFSRLEWECFIDGARKGEFNDAVDQISGRDLPVPPGTRGNLPGDPLTEGVAP